MKLIVIGLILMIFGVVIFFFYPVMKAEVNLFMLNNNNLRIQIEYIEKKTRQLTPVDNQFGIVINKIAANGKVIEFDNSDPDISFEYALLNGLVHPINSGYPGQIGNFVIFAQTSGDWYKYTRSNPEFYLIYKLKKDDIIQVFYKGNRFDYAVTNNTTISQAQIVDYTAKSDQKLLTIISGWPPGTTLYPLIVQASLVEQNP